MPPKGSGRRATKKQKLELPEPAAKIVPPPPTEPAEDHFDADLELESLFKLNYDAASGELPKLQGPAGESAPFPVNAEDLSHIPSASGPDAGPPGTAIALQKRPGRVRAQDQRRNGLPRAFAQYGSFGQMTEVECSVQVEKSDEPTPQHRLLVRQADEREAISALVKSLQPFIERENFGEDTPFPTALPAPSTGAGDISALKDFREQMTERHRQNEVPVPVDDDVGRFLLELEDGVCLHLQLPALAFPVLPSETRSEDAQYIQVGTMRINPRTHTVQLRSAVQNKAFDFDISHQNVPSTNAEVFFFSHPKSSEETGKLKIHSADTDVAISGTISVGKSSATGIDTAKKLHNLLDPLIHTKQHAALMKPPVVAAERKEACGKRERGGSRGKFL